MQIMVTGRQAGKTTAVLERLRADPDAILVVAHAGESERLKREFPELSEQIFFANSSRITLLGRHVSNLYIDNLDMVLYHLLGHPVTFATMTGETVNPEPEWYEGVADLAARTYTLVLDQVDGVNVSVHEQLAADVARKAVDWHLSPKD